MRIKKDNYIWWKVNVEGSTDFIFFDSCKLVEGLSGETNYIEEIKKELGLDIKEEYDFVLTTNREPVIYNGENDGEVVVSFGQIKMSFMSDKEAIQEWLNKYTEYEIKMKF